MKQITPQQLLTRDHCKSIVAEIERKDWEPALVVSAKGEQASHLRKQDLLTEPWPVAANEAAFLVEGLGATEAAYELGFVSPFLDSVQVQRTTKGGFFKWHRDNYEGGRRRFSVIVYLNEKFAGGGLEIEDGQVIAPRAGLAVWFPASLRHRALPVLEGTKYAILAMFSAKRFVCGWCNDLHPDAHFSGFDRETFQPVCSECNNLDL